MRTLPDTALHATRCSLRIICGKGFTLVELVVTLVIIGTLAAISAPLFSSKQTFQQSGFFHETRAAVRYAQKLAVATCSPVRVNLSAGGYQLFRAAAAPASCDNPCTLAGTPAAVIDPSDPGRNFVRAGNGVAIVTTPATTDIIFCPLGNTANPDVLVTVGTESFQVWAATGFVQ